MPDVTLPAIDEILDTDEIAPDHPAGIGEAFGGAVGCPISIATSTPTPLL